MKFHFVFHVPFEESGAIAPWASSRGHQISETRLWKNDSLPDPSGIDFAVIMGGPMNIYEEHLYPWLKTEKQWIERVIGLQKKILGVCLGAQLIADVLGGKVTRNREKEIGWFPIEWTAEGQEWLGAKERAPRVLHWHGDTFALPAGAIRLAKSAACENQAFLYKENVLGLQFHLESTPETLQLLVENCGEELVPGDFIQTPNALTAKDAPFESIHGILEAVLEKMTAVSPSRVPQR